jgi:hypothetical protein
MEPGTAHFIPQVITWNKKGMYRLFHEKPVYPSREQLTHIFPKGQTRCAIAGHAAAPVAEISIRCKTLPGKTDDTMVMTCLHYRYTPPACKKNGIRERNILMYMYKIRADLLYHLFEVNEKSRIEIISAYVSDTFNLITVSIVEISTRLFFFSGFIGEKENFYSQGR